MPALFSTRQPYIPVRIWFAFDSYLMFPFSFLFDSPPLPFPSTFPTLLIPAQVLLLLNSYIAPTPGFIQER